MIDRFIIAAYAGEMEPLLIINKTDFKIPKDIDEKINAYRSLGYDVFTTSAVTGTGIDELKENFSKHRSLFVGHSGVGKSSILNRIIPGINIKTKEISAYNDRGRHTTTSIKLYEIPSGGFIADSPGLKVMGFHEITKNDLPYYYPEFKPYNDKCHFSPCSHIHEPDCAVKTALKQGKIYTFRYENYQAIAASLE